MRLEGKHIHLRPMTLPERQKFFRWATHSDATPFWYGELYGDEVPTYIVFKHEWPDYYFNGSRPREGRCFAIIKDEKAIGEINYNVIDPHTHSVDLDIIIGSKSDQNRGYGSEAIQLLTTYLFEHMHVERCHIEVSPHNPRAIAAYNNAGFYETDRFQRDDIIWVNMEVLKEAYIKATIDSH
ncbi:MAG: GNAT family N-acetyltransferase [Bacteroidota bacterium]